MPQWQDLENQPLVDEYLRRQTMSAQDYAAFLADLKQKFPGESFLLVRYGDHQPDFSTADHGAGARPRQRWRSA